MAIVIVVVIGNIIIAAAHTVQAHWSTVIPCCR